MQGKTGALKKSDTRGDLARKDEHMRKKRRKKHQSDKHRCFVLGWKYYKGKHSFASTPEGTEHGC